MTLPSERSPADQAAADRNMAWARDAVFRLVGQARTVQGARPDRLLTVAFAAADEVGHQSGNALGAALGLAAEAILQLAAGQERTEEQL